MAIVLHVSIHANCQGSKMRLFYTKDCRLDLLFALQATVRLPIYIRLFTLPLLSTSSPFPLLTSPLSRSQNIIPSPSPPSTTFSSSFFRNTLFKMSSSRRVTQRVIHGPLHECYTCGEHFFHHEQAILHMTEEGHWPTCEICGDRFRRITQLETHLETKHHFWCQECSKTFATQRGLLDHMAAKGHRGPIHKCRHCNSMFSTEEIRDRHQRTKQH